MSRSYSDSELKALTEVKDYRSFIRLALEFRFMKNGEWGAYSRFARAARFSSRSTARDVVSGRKRMSVGALPKFISGMALSGNLREYFIWLVAREEETLNPRHWERDRIKRKLEQLRERVLRKPQEPNEKFAEGFFGTRDRFIVFAALGTAESGATLEEVMKRTRFTSKRSFVALQELEAEGMVSLKRDRYYPVATHLDFDGQASKASFEQLYRSGLEETLIRLKSRSELMHERDRLYFESLYAIDPKRGQEFRAKLRELCMEFVDQTESPDGQSLAKLLIAFEPYEPS